MLPIDETILPFGGGGLTLSKLNVSVRLLATKSTPAASFQNQAYAAPVNGTSRTSPALNSVQDEPNGELSAWGQQMIGSHAHGM